MADVKWIKITTTMFDDEKIRLIEAMPERDTILIIWVKLLTQAGRCNASGYLLLNQNIPYSDEMLSAIFNRPITSVRMALEVFKNFGMIDIDEDTLHVSNWEKHQNIEGMEKIREQTRKRVSEHREKKKLLKGSNATCNVTLTHGNAVEVEVDLDLEVDKEGTSSSSRDKNCKKTSTAAKTPETTYEQNIGFVSPHIKERISALLEDGITEPLLCRYIEVATERNRRNWAYVEKIALDNLKDGIKTLEQYKAMCIERRNNYKKSITQTTPNNPFYEIGKDEGLW